MDFCLREESIILTWIYLTIIKGFLVYLLMESIYPWLKFSIYLHAIFDIVFSNISLVYVYIIVWVTSFVLSWTHQRSSSNYDQFM